MARLRQAAKEMSRPFLTGNAGMERVLPELKLSIMAGLKYGDAIPDIHDTLSTILTGLRVSCIGRMKSNRNTFTQSKFNQFQRTSILLIYLVLCNDRQTWRSEPSGAIGSAITCSCGPSTGPLRSVPRESFHNNIQRCYIMAHQTHQTSHNHFFFIKTAGRNPLHSISK